jgi:hypothetical protein
VRTSGDPRNRDFAASHLEISGDVSAASEALGFDPQTAGGLLISLPREKALSLETEFAAKRIFLRRVGHVEEGAGVVVQ